MKAKLPLPKNLKEMAFRFAKEETERQQKNATRRLYKIMILALVLVFGFGKTRIQRFKDMVNELVEQSATDEAFYYHLDKRLIDQLGLDFEREDYEKLDR